MRPSVRPSHRSKPIGELGVVPDSISGPLGDHGPVLGKRPGPSPIFLFLLHHRLFPRDFTQPVKVDTPALLGPFLDLSIGP